MEGAKTGPVTTRRAPTKSPCRSQGGSAHGARSRRRGARLQLGRLAHGSGSIAFRAWAGTLTDVTTHADEPLHEVAEVLLTTAPAIAHRARGVGWLKDGGVDWMRVLEEWEEVSGGWSGGEQRLLGSAVALYEASTFGLDAPNLQALVDALRTGLGAAQARLAEAEAGRALLQRMLGQVPGS